MTPREALDALRGLVDSMKCAGCDGRGVVSIARLNRFGEPIREDHATRRSWRSIRCSMCCGDGADARAIAARPALETLAGCVVLSVDEAKHAEGWIHAGHDSECPQCLRLRAAIAEAEEAMR